MLLRGKNWLCICVLCVALVPAGIVSAQGHDPASDEVNTAADSADDRLTRLRPGQVVTIGFAGLPNAVVVCRIGPSGSVVLPTRTGNVYVRIAGLNAEQAASHIAEQLGLDPLAGVVAVVPGGSLPVVPPLRSAFGRDARSASVGVISDDTAVVPLQPQGEPALVILNDHWCLTPLIFRKPADPSIDLAIITATAVAALASAETRSSSHELRSGRESPQSEPRPAHTSGTGVAKSAAVPVPGAGSRQPEPARTGATPQRSDSGRQQPDAGSDRSNGTGKHTDRDGHHFDGDGNG